MADDNVIVPGKVIKSFVSKSGKPIVLRFAQLSDLEQMTKYINDVSAENTFITLSGEVLTLEEEAKYLQDALDKIERNEAIKVFAFHNNLLIGSADISRLIRRSKHVGHVGISIKKEYRDEGIGFEMLKTLIDLARNLEYKLFELTVFAINEPAIHLYKKVGFIEAGRVPKKFYYKGKLEDQLIMYKELS